MSKSMQENCVYTARNDGLSAAVEQTDQLGVDVPDFVGARSSNADFWLGWINALSGSAPAVKPDQAAPGIRRSKDLPDSLGQPGLPPTQHAN